MKKEELKGYFEIKSFPVQSTKKFDKAGLLESMDMSQVKHFGWPIGIVLHVDKYRPKPTNEGVVAEVSREDEYDFWKLTEEGQLYILLTLFEDRRKAGVIFFDTRINRTTEALMRIGRLYKHLGFPETQEIAIEMEYGGLKERTLTVASPRRWMDFERKCAESKYSGQIVCPLAELLSVDGLKNHVFSYLKPFFELFDFFKTDRKLLGEIVEAYFNGKVT